MRALLEANKRLKAQVGAQDAAVQRAEAERLRALQTATELQMSLKQSEEQLVTLRSGFLSLDGICDFFHFDSSA